MKHSLIPVTFDEQHGVNLHMYDRVLFVPGQNMWGLDPEVEVEGTYVGWNRPQFSALEIKIDHIQSGPLPLRFNVPIENVFRIWDARDDEIEALRKELEPTRAELRPLMTVEEWFKFNREQMMVQFKDALGHVSQGIYGGTITSFEWHPEDPLKGDPD